MLLNEGLMRVRELLQNDISTGQLGTSTDAVSQAQTGLQTAVSASDQSVTVSGTDKLITVEYELDSVTATGNTFTEFIVENSSDETFNRILFTGIAHSGDTEVHAKLRFFIRPV